jgi:hypothetical protein
MRDAFMLRAGFARSKTKPLCIGPGRPWENGCVESFHGKPRDELLNGERFDTLWKRRC